jgi:hypothetical protein
MGQTSEQGAGGQGSRLSRYQELLDARREAGCLARAGERGAGYRRLLAAAREGERALQAGEPWAGDLVDRYYLALSSYERQFRLQPASPAAGRRQSA